MTGSILVVDSVATNRIVLKTALATAQYNVLSCASCAEAKEIIEKQRPDLMIINLIDPTEDAHKFCQTLKRSPLNMNLAIVAVGVADTDIARFEALNAGVDDVLPLPRSNELLLARIRGLLRQRSATLEWTMREETARALGFQEVAAPRITPSCVVVVSMNPNVQSALTKNLRSLSIGQISKFSASEALNLKDKVPTPDVLILDAYNCNDSNTICNYIADLRSRSQTRRSEILVIINQRRADLAARLFDLGANDIAYTYECTRELVIRIKKLAQQKARQDEQKRNVHNGLNAAVTDALTGLYNRRYAETHLTRIADQARKSGHSYALMVADIDHFKSINDRFGHAAGDDILKNVAQMLKDNFRSIDLVARIGGEEFLICMPNTTTAQAKIAAERMRRNIRKQTFMLNDGETIVPVTISVGVAVDLLSKEHEVTTSQMFDRADAALYAAKVSGRDKVSICREAA